MSANLHDWARKWGLSVECLRDLQITLGTYTPPLAPDAPGVGKSEAWAQSALRIEASRKGVKLFRNNVGALSDKTGRFVRYGLANDSKTQNEILKSGDLIGLRPTLIAGHVYGIFVSREMKSPGWQYTGTEREVAQLNWINLINSCGGDAAFATGPEGI